MASGIVIQYPFSLERGSNVTRRSEIHWSYASLSTEADVSSRTNTAEPSYGKELHLLKTWGDYQIYIIYPVTQPATY